MNRKRTLLIVGILLLAVAGIYSAFFSKSRDIRVLVFSKTESFRHESIEAGKKALFELAKKHNFKVDTTEDASMFKEAVLKNYNVVMFLNTTGDVLNDAQQLEFNRFIQAGGGYVGVHAAADTEYDWAWYGKLVGAYFSSHPNDPNVREAVVQVLDNNHPSTKSFDKNWKRSDEWYNYTSINPAINTLMNLDESTYEGGTNGKIHPISWYHEFDGGRSFYTGMGHTKEAYEEPAFLEHLWGGISYAAGDGVPVNYNIATVAPEENRFQKVVLDDYLDEPMELEILPNGNILYIERPGNIKVFNFEVDSSALITTLDVHTEHEDGLLGMAIDPNYKENQWIYLFYSPVGDEAKQYVSRFTFDGKNWDPSSEKVMLEIPTQRDECCHSAGSLEFGPEGMLYISVGDNTNPHASDGYAPIDEREGRSPWDAQKSSANTNDLRGKILRIQPEEDGTYSIPNGNLFNTDGSEGRPEIYVMGCRNPYRISIDPHTKYVYWGDVGPDAGEDSVSRGPRGHDEVNQARKAGFFGWPYFVGNNKPYHDYDFTQQVSYKPFDPEKPINNSPNNTGIEELPPAQEAFIWYPYSASEEFPDMGTGGRNAMAGPVFYANDYPENDSRFPSYYNGKLFTYDWMRGWMMAVTMNEEGDLERIERFLPNMELNNPIDMLFSPQGDMYLLEYGTRWFTSNPDARLVHIPFISGNRPPVASIEVDKQIGAIPMNVNLSADESLDYDGDSLTYHWYVNGEKIDGSGSQNTYQFSSAGDYKVKVVAEDTEGEQGEAEIKILAGNELPELAINLEGNKSFYWDNEAVTYEVSVKDAEDGSIGQGISASQVILSMDYLARGFDKNTIAMGHEAQVAASQSFLGEQLINESGCKNCHQMAEKSVGPAYVEVAERYKDREDAVAYLAGKVINGGNGNWGEIAMAAHPQLSNKEAELMVNYILSLGDGGQQANGLPLNGTFTFNEHAQGEETGTYVILASYTDKGASGAQSLTARELITLSHPKIQAEHFTETNNAMTFEVKPDMMPGIKESFEIVIGSHGSFITFEDLDMTNVRSLTLAASAPSMFLSGGNIKLFLDGPEGELIGEVEIETVLNPTAAKPVEMDIKPVVGVQKLYLEFVNPEAERGVATLDWIYFNNQAGSL